MSESDSRSPELSLVDRLQLIPNTPAEEAAAVALVRRRVADPGDVLTALGLNTTGT